MIRAITHHPTRQEQRLPMTYNEWLGWASESQQSEWVDGEAIVFMPPSIRHAQVIRLLSTLLSIYVDLRRLGELLVAPVEMRLEHSAREPDILFIAQQHLDRLTSQRLVGPADLVIELISPDSINRDRVAKFDEYQAAGVPEYWLFDPRPGQQSSQFFQLGSSGRYDAVGSGKTHCRIR
jgi:Uma2 family endonuclease